MSPRRTIFLVAAASVLATVSALAANDPMAGCRTLVSEAEFDAAGLELVVTSEPDLTHFPSGFLDRCDGNIDIHAIVHEDGSVGIVGFDHGVTCGAPDWPPDQAFRSAAWHDSVIHERLVALHYAPPLMANKSVCVEIDRGWIPDAPHRLWSPYEWEHRK